MTLSDRDFRMKTASSRCGASMLAAVHNTIVTALVKEASGSMAEFGARIAEKQSGRLGSERRHPPRLRFPWA